MAEMFEVKRYEFVLEAAQPVCHLETTLGNHGLLMRRKTRQPDGSWANVPVITADTMRHHLRAAASMAVLDAVGMLHPGAMSEAALRLMFAGGMITGSAGGSVKLDRYRELCELIPPLALFGGCAENRCIPGRMNVDDAVLICDESMHQIPAHAAAWMADHGGAVDAGRAHVEEVQRVRMDPSLDPARRALLTDGDKVSVNERLRLSEQAGADGDAVARAASRSTMLPRTFERVCAGSLFFWAVQCTLLSDLDLDTFNTAVLGFLGRAVVGGKQATGHGTLRVRWAWQHTLARPVESPSVFETGALSPRVGAMLRAHMSERRDRVRQFLQGVAS